MSYLSLTNLELTAVSGSIAPVQCVVTLCQEQNKQVTQQMYNHIKPIIIIVIILILLVVVVV